mmetsp:Transcript_63530/g.124741  ORF Transcript_63530/g.124741 Transcript_63530/m.124741 type:complete len:253 (-) Transcript_63530:257-1015(-)
MKQRNKNMSCFLHCVLFLLVVPEAFTFCSDLGVLTFRSMYCGELEAKGSRSGMIQPSSKERQSEPRGNRGFFGLVKLSGSDRGDRSLRTYYSILKVKKKASSQEIRQSFRKLVKENHPDSNERADDDDYQKLVEAYKVLSNEELRKGYDRKMKSPLSQLFGLAMNVVRLSADLVVDVAVPLVRDVVVPTVVVVGSAAGAAASNVTAGDVVTFAAEVVSTSQRAAQQAPRFARAIAEAAQEEFSSTESGNSTR